MAIDLPFQRKEEGKPAEFAESELILNADGSVYHLSLKPQDISDTIIVVGDPGRVFRISRHFKSIDFEMNKREFTTHVGEYKGRRLTVISSGMGTGNVEVLMHELDALANINLKTRRRKSKRQKLTIVRVGTSGALQPELPCGTLLASDMALGLDTIMHFYQHPQSESERKITIAAEEQLELAFRPYAATGSERLLKKMAHDLPKGLTVTAPGFYAPQGRVIRYKPKIDDLLGKMQSFRHAGRSIANCEMETAAYYAFGQLLGHDTLSLNALIANRADGLFSDKPNKVIDRLIELTLDRIVLV